MPLLLQHKLEKNPNYCGFVEPEFQLVKVRTSFTNRRMPLQRDECNIKIPSRWGLEFPRVALASWLLRGFRADTSCCSLRETLGGCWCPREGERGGLGHHCPELLCAFFNTRDVPNCQSNFYISAFYFY